MAEFDGKVVLVTGGTRGIGHELVCAFATAGAHVVFSGTSTPSVAEATVSLRERLGPDAALKGLVADLAEAAAPARLVTQTVAALGGIDVLVCNGGVSGPTDPWTLQPDEWDRILAINLRATFFCGREAAASMRQRGGGSIINIASVAGQIGGAATGPAYVASKAGMIGLTKSQARHLAAAQICVNCVAPADINTDMTADWSSELRQRLVAMTPLGRFGHVKEISGAVLFLASTAASFVTGQTLNVNGGIYMG